MMKVPLLISSVSLIVILTGKKVKETSVSTQGNKKKIKDSPKFYGTFATLFA